MRETEAERIDQFDGLRALSFLGVFVFHAAAIPFTWMGVDQFFVLSGYLITRNLFALRARARPATALTVFYYRRLLRIVPPYYLALLAIMVLEPFPWSEAPWYFAFASNIRDSLYPPLKGQLLTMWSIAVEEQFYLLWPWLVLLLPERRFKSLFVLSIVGALLVRWTLSPINSNAVYRLVVCRMDLLGAGAWVAWQDGRDPTWLRRRLPWFWAAGALSVAVFALLSAIMPTFELEQQSMLYDTLGYSLEAIVFTSMLVVVRTARSGWIYRALRFRPLEYLGRISYMAYLCHVVCLHQARRLGLSGPATVALGLVATVLFASASWYLVEQPLQRLRKVVAPG